MDIEQDRRFTGLGKYSRQDASHTMTVACLRQSIFHPMLTAYHVNSLLPTINCWDAWTIESATAGNVADVVSSATSPVPGVSGVQPLGWSVPDMTIQNRSDLSGLPLGESNLAIGNPSVIRKETRRKLGMSL